MKEQGSKHYFFIIKINKHTQIIKPEMVVYLMPSWCPLHDQSNASKVQVSAEKYTEGYENAKANLMNKHVRVFGVFLSRAFLIIVGSSNSTFTIAKLHSKSELVLTGRYLKQNSLFSLVEVSHPTHTEFFQFDKLGTFSADSLHNTTITV